MALEPGIERTDEFVVEGRLMTDVGGTIGASVLSTPGMIGMIERNAAVLALENLDEGKATVGFEVCVKHVAAAAEGQTGLAAGGRSGSLARVTAYPAARAYPAKSIAFRTAAPPGSLLKYTYASATPPSR